MIEVGTWILLYAIFNLLTWGVYALIITFGFKEYESWDRYYFCIDIPPKDKRILKSKEPLYKVEKNHYDYSDGWGVSKYEKSWGSIGETYDMDENGWYFFPALLYGILMPFFIRLRHYKYRKVGWLRLPVVRKHDKEKGIEGSTYKEDLEAFHKKGKDLGQHFDLTTKSIWDEYEEDNKKKKQEQDRISSQIDELNEDFNEHYIA